MKKSKLPIELEELGPSDDSPMHKYRLTLRWRDEEASIEDECTLMRAVGANSKEEFNRRLAELNVRQPRPYFLVTGSGSSQAPHFSQKVRESAIVCVNPFAEGVKIVSGHQRDIRSDEAPKVSAMLKKEDPEFALKTPLEQARQVFEFLHRHGQASKCRELGAILYKEREVELRATAKIYDGSAADYALVLAHQYDDLIQDGEFDFAFTTTVLKEKPFLVDLAYANASHCTSLENDPLLRPKVKKDKNGAQVLDFGILPDMERVVLLIEMEELQRKIFKKGKKVSKESILEELEEQGRRKRQKVEKMQPNAIHPYYTESEITNGYHNRYAMPISAAELARVKFFNQAAKARGETKLPFVQYRRTYSETLVLYEGADISSAICGFEVGKAPEFVEGNQYFHVFMGKSYPLFIYNALGETPSEKFYLWNEKTVNICNNIRQYFQDEFKFDDYLFSYQESSGALLFAPKGEKTREVFSRNSDLTFFLEEIGDLLLRAPYFKTINRDNDPTCHFIEFKCPPARLWERIEEFKQIKKARKEEELAHDPYLEQLNKFLEEMNARLGYSGFEFKFSRNMANEIVYISPKYLRPAPNMPFDGIELALYEFLQKSAFPVSLRENRTHYEMFFPDVPSLIFVLDRAKQSFGELLARSQMLITPLCKRTPNPTIKHESVEAQEAALFSRALGDRRRGGGLSLVAPPPSQNVFYEIGKARQRLLLAPEVDSNQEDLNTLHPR